MSARARIAGAGADHHRQPVLPCLDGGDAEAAYRAAFGTIGLAVLAGLAVYLTARDAKPRG